MALIVLTEDEPHDALKRLFKRSAYVVVPVSIMFIKYFPEIGRKAGPWATASMNTGDHHGKEPVGSGLPNPGFLFVLASITDHTRAEGH